MKRLNDYDEYEQGVPKNRPLYKKSSSRARDYRYVTTEEFEDMQTELRKKLEEQVTVQEQMLLELKQVKLHLASISDQTVEDDDAS